MTVIPKTPPYHGGNLDEAVELFGQPEGGWIDLSTGINPNPYPGTSVTSGSLTQLPQAGPLGALLDAARRYYKVPDGASIIAAPGSQAVLQVLPTLSSALTVAVVGPTYNEHAETWRDCGHRVMTVLDVSSGADADVVVLVNPNNPDGRRHPPAEIVAAARVLRERGGLLVVDEAFADVAPQVSVIPEIGDAPIIAVRSFGKFFGLPGLRLGFAVGTPKRIEALRRRLGPWAVSGPAIEIGIRALNDENWIKKTRISLSNNSEKLNSMLRGFGLYVVGGTELYRLVDHPKAPEFFERLGRAGIFVRRFPDHPNWLRIGLPGSAADFQRLEAALS